MRGTRLGVLPPLPVDVYARRPAKCLPFPLEEIGCQLFSKGRHGLQRGILALGLAHGDEVLVPAYHHGSEVEALAQSGVTCRFYDSTDTLEPDPDELSALVGDRTRALLLTHYMGFPQDSPRWRAWCDDRGLFLIEDAAQSWLARVDGRPVGTFGHLAIFCLYKTFGLPDGAATVATAPIEAPRSARRLRLATVVRGHGRWLGMRSSSVSKAGAWLRREKPYERERDFQFGDPEGPSAFTRLLLTRVAVEEAAAQRRRNYMALLDQLIERVPTSFRALPPGASPHSFAIETDRRTATLKMLEDDGIRAFAFWSYPHPLLRTTAFPGAAARRENIVILPVHQELRPADLERIVSSAKRCA